MKTKRLVIVLVIALISAMFFGCDAINAVIDTAFLDAPDVRVADLDDFSGTEVSDETDSIKAGFEFAIEVLGNSAVVARLMGDDYPEFVQAVRYASPELSMFINDGAASKSATASASVSIADEEVSFDGLNAQVDELSVSAKVDIDDLVNTEKIEAEFDVKAKIDLLDAISDYVYDDQSNLVYVEIADMLLNFSGKGNGTATDFVYDQPTLISYYTGFDLSLGFTLDATDYSGKYEVNLKYVNSAEVDTDDVDPSFTGEESVTITVYVYDNNDDLIGEASYTEDQIIDLAMSM